MLTLDKECSEAYQLPPSISADRSFICFLSWLAVKASSRVSSRSSTSGSRMFSIKAAAASAPPRAVSAVPRATT